jgi:hypothetical protein
MDLTNTALINNIALIGVENNNKINNIIEIICDHDHDDMYYKKNENYNINEVDIKNNTLINLISNHNHNHLYYNKYEVNTAITTETKRAKTVEDLLDNRLFIIEDRLMKETYRNPRCNNDLIYLEKNNEYIINYKKELELKNNKIKYLQRIINKKNNEIKNNEIKNNEIKNVEALLHKLIILKNKEIDEINNNNNNNTNELLNNLAKIILKK